MRTLQTSLLVNRRQKRQSHRQHSLRIRLERGAFGCAAALVILMAAAFAVGAFTYARLTSNLPSLGQLQIDLNPKDGLLLKPTELYDRDGQTLLYRVDNGIPRRYLTVNPDQPEHVSPFLTQVTVALNEPGFWTSPGFAWWKPADPQPQTLAELLVDDLLLEKEPPGLRRTLRMRLLAAQMVSVYGRSQVLEWYLNSASYGRLAYGADNAARLYLGKPASQLNLAEATMLAVVAQAPALNPIDAPTAALEREKDALERLVSQGVISRQEAARAEAVSLSLRQAPPSTLQIAPAFSRYVLDEVEESLGRNRVERGGLKVITTLDYSLQLQMTCAARTQLARLEGRPDSTVTLPGKIDCESARLLPTLPPLKQALPADTRTSLLVMDLQSGQILAMMGDAPATSGGESQGLTAHQPGSLLSPFVALAGFVRGFGPGTLMWDIPANLPAELDGRQNPDNTFHGPQRLRLALANDYLMPMAKLLVDIGPANVWRQVEPLGLNLLGSRSPASLLFEGGQANIVEIARAYSTFANLGVQHGEVSSTDNNLRPGAVLKVEDAAGYTLLETGAPEERALVSAQLSYLVHNVLSDETARWPSLGYPNPLEIGRPVGAKIGQLADGSQAWTAGYTHQRLSVVWMGLPQDGTGDMRIEPKTTAGIWYAMMQYAMRDLPLEDWTRPDGISQVSVCNPSGKLPTAVCPSTVDEVFSSGNEPTEQDDLYRIFQINRETGRLATVFTPLELVKQQTFLVVPPEALDWAQSAGLELPPSAYDDIQAPAPLPGVEITSPGNFAFVKGKVVLRGSASGNQFASYRVQVGQGLNPQDWVQVGEVQTTPVDNGSLAEWDTKGLDGLYAVRLVVLRQDNRIESGVIQVTVDNTPPAVQVSYPASQQHFHYPAENRINFLADVSDVGGISRVEWFVDGQKVGDSAQAPYSFPWQGGSGQHRLQVKAYDQAGNMGQSDAIVFYLDP